MASADAIRAEIARLEARWAASETLGAHFSHGTGQPGNAYSRRTRKAAAKRLDASIDVAVRLNRLRADLATAEARERRAANRPTKEQLEQRLSDFLAIRASGVFRGQPLDANGRECLNDLIRSTRRALKSAETTR